MEFEKKAKLPGNSGVYAFLDKEDNPLYIGQSSFIRMRIYCFNKPHVIKEAESFECFICSKTQAKYIESELIKRFNPTYNVQTPNPETREYSEQSIARAIDDLNLSKT